MESHDLDRVSHRSQGDPLAPLQEQCDISLDRRAEIGTCLNAVRFQVRLNVRSLQNHIGSTTCEVLITFRKRPGARSPTVMSATKWAIMGASKLPVQARITENSSPIMNVDASPRRP